MSNGAGYVLTVYTQENTVTTGITINLTSGESAPYGIASFQLLDGATTSDVIGLAITPGMDPQFGGAFSQAVVAMAATTQSATFDGTITLDPASPGITVVYFGPPNNPYEQGIVVRPNQPSGSFKFKAGGSAAAQAASPDQLRAAIKMVREKHSEQT